MAISIEMFKDSKKTREFQPGEVVFEEGMSGDFMYVVLDGEVDIILHNVVINKIMPEKYFAKWHSFITARAAPAARAGAPTKLALVNRFDFTFYVQHSPFFALDIMETMAKRSRLNMAC